MSNSPDSHFFSHLAHQRTIVLGGGITGMSLRSFLQTHAESVLVIDEKPSIGDARHELTKDDLEHCDLVVVSPGWKMDHPFVRMVRERGIPLLSEIDLAWQVKQARTPSQQWVGITGTNGKTTTVHMVESIFRAAHINGVACGNVGDTVIDAVMHEPAYDYLAIELSSFQLEWSSHARYAAGAILNIAEDHLDWHGNFARYVAAKHRLLEASTIAIVNRDDQPTRRCGEKLPPQSTRYFTLDTPQRGELGLVENLLIDRAFIEGNDAEVIAELSDIVPAVPHNVSNALAAGALARAIGISANEVQLGIKNFRLDHHRLETVAVHRGITWVNDSKATNPHAALAALQSQLSAVWIAGGLAKGASMDELIIRGKSRVKAVILIGTDAPLIEESLIRHAPDVPRFHIGQGEHGAPLMRKIVAKAVEIAVEGDTVLLAPACASMDQFSSYADRGELFAQMVNEIVVK